MTIETTPTEHPTLDVGDRVKFPIDRNRWEVQAVTENFVALTQNRFGQTHYTVIDWRQGLRGPCNLVGQGWGDGTYSPEQCAEMLEEFENHYREDPAKTAALAEGRTSWTPSFRTLEISHRNHVRVHIERIDAKASA